MLTIVKCVGKGWLIAGERVNRIAEFSGCAR